MPRRLLPETAVRNACFSIRVRPIQFDSDPALVAYRKWLADNGWIHPVNIAGRLYVTREEIESFKARASNGEFAKAASGAAARGGSNHQSEQLEVPVS